MVNFGQLVRHRSRVERHRWCQRLVGWISSTVADYVTQSGPHSLVRSVSHFCSPARRFSLPLLRLDPHLPFPHFQRPPYRSQLQFHRDNVETKPADDKTVNICCRSMLISESYKSAYRTTADVATATASTYPLSTTTQSSTSIHAHLPVYAMCRPV